MAITESQPRPSEGVFVVMCFIAFVMVTTYLFASCLVWMHEQTAQHCIQSGRVWQSDNCLTYHLN